MNKSGKFCAKSKKYFKEYAELTGIHGIRYLAENRSKSEKIFWTVILILSIGCCSYLINSIYQKFQNSPIIVIFESKETPIYQIPFPAVTLCTEQKTRRNAFNISEINLKLREKTATEQEKKMLSYLSIYCKDDIAWFKGNLTEKNDTFLEEFYTYINSVKPSKKILIQGCSWMGQHYDQSQCLKEFTPILTDNGICYSFNFLDRSEIFKKDVIHYLNYGQVGYYSSQWNVEEGYQDRAGIYTYPRRALFSGQDNSLRLSLGFNRNETEFLCSKPLEGVRILLHNPMEVPRLAKHNFRVTPNQAVSVAIQPQLMTTSRDVMDFGPEKRECYFQFEKPLRNFKIYTQQNCQLECLTNFTLNKCGCVYYYMPRDNLTAICGSAKIECIMTAEHDMKIEELQSKLFNDLDKNSSYSECDCKPLCTELRYDVEVSQTEFKSDEFSFAGGFSCGEADRYSELSIYFKSDQFMGSQRNELYGLSDLVSNFGGLLGLFTGFSIISMAEILYFLTLRIFCNCSLYGRWFGTAAINS